MQREYAGPSFSDLGDLRLSACAPSRWQRCESRSFAGTNISSLEASKTKQFESRNIDVIDIPRLEALAKLMFLISNTSIRPTLLPDRRMPVLRSGGGFG